MSSDSDLDSPIPKRRAGRPLKKTRGRPRTNTSPRTSNEAARQQHRDRQRRFRQQHPDQQQSYQQLHEEEHADAQQRYMRNNPGAAEAHSSAQQRYIQQNPGAADAHAVDQQNYMRNTPHAAEAHTGAQQRYIQQNPGAADSHALDQQNYMRNTPHAAEAHSSAQVRFMEQNPGAAEAHSAAQERYAQAHPEIVQERGQEYRAAHPHQNALRHLAVVNRRNVGQHGPMAFWQSEQLGTIQAYRLAKPNLYHDDIYRCRFCQARLFQEEPRDGKWCCGEGKYNVLNLPPLDNALYKLTAFRERTRAYNDMNAFCALGVSGGYRHPSGLAFFKIEGRMYHRIFSLDAPGDSTRYNREQRFINHCRLYIDDGEERRNLAEGRRLNTGVVDAVTAFLTARNPYIREFKKLGQEQSATARLDFQVTSRQRDGPVLGDRNPGLEVHAVVNREEHQPDGPRTLTIWKSAEQRPTTISVFHPLMEPFQYPLLYPDGTPGWQIGRLDNAGGKLSQLNYTRCLLLSEPRFSELGRLSQAWQVEMFVRYEEEKLNYISRNQTGYNRNQLRVAPVNELEAVINARPQQPGDVANVAADINGDETVQGEGGPRAGKLYLPSTFTGSPRYMKKRYLNAMGLVTRKGAPTYFLTFTACGQWDELVRSTRHGNRCDPSTCCRIFHLKLLELLRDIRSGAIFGKKSYILYVIEMQMRGLPHAHIAIRVEDGGPKQGRDIDRVIRADIPTPEEAGGRLRELVLRHMVHGPCGRRYNRTNLPCWDDEKGFCQKYFPKPHCEATHTDERGIVHYRRDHFNTTTTRYRGRDVEVHEGWIVPYNACLLLKYEAHINLEICSTRKVVKYLFKYLHKGGSHQNVRVLPLHQQQNEPEEYATKRMIGASDACWRLLGYDLTASEPTVQMLPVHLEGQHSAVFRPGNEADAVANASSKLLIYMSRPLDEIFDSLTYQDLNENFILHSKRPPTRPDKPVYAHPDGRHFFTRRERGECVTRMFWVSPNRVELYYLRVLLSSLPCRGYADMLARGGEGCTTFQEVARSLGLADNEQEYAEALEEAAQFMTGPQLRDFFVMLANIGAPVALLWDRFKNAICEDHLERNPGDPERAYKLSLIQIDRSLRRHGSGLAAHGLPVVEDDSTELGRQLLNYSADVQNRMLEEWAPQLTAEQRAVLDHVKALIESEQPPTGDSSRILFLDGPGGYGKTTLLKVLTSYVRSHNKIALCVASSGIAALNMEGGFTAHSMFKLPLDLGGGAGTWNIHNGTQRAELVKAASLIVFDEAPMAHQHLFEMLDRSLQDLMGSDLPFGGKILLCSGDFRQIPPIVEKARSPNDIVAVSLRSSRLWQLFKVFNLTVPQRTRGSDGYSRFLLTVGNGTLPERTFGQGRETEKLVPLTGMDHVTNLEALIDHIYPADVICNPDAAAKRAILSTLNINVKDINSVILENMEGESRRLYSHDAVDKETDDGLEVDDETLHQATGKGVPDHLLTLKVGAVCFIIRNLNIEQGLVNGTKVIVEGITPRLVKVRKAGDDTIFGVPRISFKLPVIIDSPLIMLRRQFPLQLAYAMSFHKSQGQTIQLVGVDLRTDCFTHGQLYVGLSRVQSPNDIRVLVQSDRVHDGVAYTKNIVYRDLLTALATSFGGPG